MNAIVVVEVCEVIRLLKYNCATILLKNFKITINYNSNYILYIYIYIYITNLPVNTIVRHRQSGDSQG